MPWLGDRAFGSGFCLAERRGAGGRPAGRRVSYFFLVVGGFSVEGGFSYFERRRARERVLGPSSVFAFFFCYVRDGLHIDICAHRKNQKGTKQASHNKLHSSRCALVASFVFFGRSEFCVFFVASPSSSGEGRGHANKRRRMQKAACFISVRDTQPAPHNPNPAATRRGDRRRAVERSPVPSLRPLAAPRRYHTREKKITCTPVRRWLLARVLGLARAPLLSRYYIPLRRSRLAPLSSRSLLLLTPPSLPRLYSSVSFVVIVVKNFYSGRSVLSRGYSKR